MFRVPGYLTGGAVSAQAAAARFMNELRQRQETGEPSDSEWVTHPDGTRTWSRKTTIGPLPRQQGS